MCSGSILNSYQTLRRLALRLPRNISDVLHIDNKRNISVGSTAFTEQFLI